MRERFVWNTVTLSVRDIYIDMYRLTCIVRYVLILQAYPAIYIKGHTPHWVCGALPLLLPSYMVSVIGPD